VTAVSALLVTSPLGGGHFKIMPANRLARCHVDVFGDYQKFSGNAQQCAARCTFIGSME